MAENGHTFVFHIVYLAQIQYLLGKLIFPTAFVQHSSNFMPHQ